MDNIQIFQEKIKLPYKDITLEKIQKITFNLLKELNLLDRNFNLIITNNKNIKQINKDYRQKNDETDVISFVYDNQGFPKVMELNDFLGDIFISLEKIADQAKLYQVTFEYELIRIIIHGVLHLIGYDHEKSEAEARKMEKIEERLLSKVLSVPILE